MKRRGFLQFAVPLLAVVLLVLGLIGAVSAQAAIGPKWWIDSVANTTAAPNEELTFAVGLANNGDGNIPPSPGGDAENCVPGAPAPADPAKCYRVTASFPAGMKPLKARYEVHGVFVGLGICATPVGQTITCSAPMNNEADAFPPGGGSIAKVMFTVRLSKEAAGTLTSKFEVSGAEIPSTVTIDPTRITKAPPQFGIDAFDALAPADPSGAELTTSAAHPRSVTTWLHFNTHTELPLGIYGSDVPVEPLRDAVVDLPPGLIGNPAIGKRCTSAELGGDGEPTGGGTGITCPAESQVGRMLVTVDSLPNVPGNAFSEPLFNMVPPPGVAARFGFIVLGTMVVLDAHLRQQPDGTWTVAVTSAQTSEGLGIPGVETEFWGVPASAENEFWRHCPGKYVRAFGGPSCRSEAPEEAFFRMPTSCTQVGKGLPWSVHADSWWNPGATEPGGAPDLADSAWKSRSIESHQPPGYPLAPEPSSFPAGYTGPTEWGAPAGIEHCAEVPFDPTSSLQPTTPAADSPSGLNFEIHMPQNGLTNPAPGAIAESDLKAVSVKLPEGFSVNPSAANGHLACSVAQIGLKSPVGQTPAVFSGAPQECPEAAKVGRVTIESPLLTEPEEPKVVHPLKGSVYLAAQHENPFGSLLALYLVVEDPQSGTILKLPGEVKADPNTGRLETLFENNPQLPFSNLHVELFPGPRAALRTPSACGSYQAQVTLTPWSGNAPVPFDEPVEVSSGPGGNCPTGAFEPKLEAGTANPLAGSFSPFNLNLSREDGTQELGGLTVALPEGLLASLRGIPYCPDSVLAAISGELGTGRAQEANPSCPAASRVGRVTVGAGPGPDLFYTQSARAYLAGPYEGAPLSIAVVAPAVAGPFDLGNVVVRNALRIDPETAQATAVSDPLPHILHGIPLDLRDVRVELNRPSFTLNPTSCEPMQLGVQVSSTAGGTANLAERFQVAGCDKLGFKPKLTLKLKGKTSRRAHPSLSATLTMPATNQANIARAQVTLPHAEFLDQGHIRNVCTQVQFKAAGCPASSILGHATAYSPLLDNPLSGPVYLMSGFGHKLPDLAADLNGQIRVLLHGKVDTGPGGGIRNTFEVVPDAPVTKFVLSLKGGSKGLIQNSEDVCAHSLYALALFDAHNGKVHDTQPPLRVDCGRGGKKHRKR